MTFPRESRSAVVSGASSGIGLACAKRLAEDGFRVFAGVRQASDGRTLEALGLEGLSPLTLDITEAESIADARRVVEQALRPAGLSLLVNNAGIVVPGSLEFLPISEIRRQFEVNVFGHIAVTQAFLPLIRLGQGRIVNMGSTGGTIAMPFIGPYNASKFALEALTDALRLELRPWGIPVSIVEPSFIETPLWEKTAARGEEMVQALPEEAHRLYGPAFAAVRNAYKRFGRRATPAGAVADVVLHVATVKRPKTRYPVGRGAQMQLRVFARLPQGLRDFLIASFLARSRTDDRHP